MDFKYERKINYYETDKMGVVHHSNYIRFLEEARCYFLEAHDFPYDFFEKSGISIPVVHVDVAYKTPVTYNDTIVIRVFIKDYTGIRLTVGYDVINKETGNTVIVAETKHCFTNNDLRPLNLKKYSLELHSKYEKLKDND